MHVILLTDVLIYPEGETYSSCRNVWIVRQLHICTHKLYFIYLY